MNIKRLVAGAAAAAMIMGATAVPALAFDGDGAFTLIKNWAWVKNITITKADTGGNLIDAGDNVDGGAITTGAAVAGASVTNVVNSNNVDPCGCLFEDDGGLLTIIKNGAGVKNITITKADTGDNSIMAVDDVTGGSIGTGDATAGSIVTNVVNTNMVGTGI